VKCLLILLFDEHGGDLATYYRASKDIFDITIFDESAGRMASFLSDTGKGHEMRFKDFVQNYADEAASGMASMFGEKKEDILRGIEQGAYRSIPQAHKDALEELRTAILERIKLTQTGQNAIAALDAANDHVMLHSAMPLPAKKYHELTRSQRKEADALLEKFNKKVEAAQRKVQHARREAEAARQNMFGAVRNAASPVDMFGNAANHAAGLQSARAALAEAERELQELQSGAAQYRQNVINFAGAQESMLHGLTPDQIRKMTLEDIKNMALKEMTSG
jgi:hypothetical protein